MVYVPPPALSHLHDAATVIPGTHTPPVVRGAYNIPEPIGTVSVAAIPADVFQSFNGVRAALFVHCPTGLNNAMELAHRMKGLG